MKKTAEDRKNDKFMPMHGWALEIHIENLKASFTAEEMQYVLKRCGLIPYETEAIVQKVAKVKKVR